MKQIVPSTKKELFLHANMLLAIGHKKLLAAIFENTNEENDLVPIIKRLENNIEDKSEAIKD